jgi:hypothetical protein
MWAGALAQSSPPHCHALLRPMQTTSSNAACQLPDAGVSPAAPGLLQWRSRAGRPCRLPSGCPQRWLPNSSRARHNHRKPNPHYHHNNCCQAHSAGNTCLQLHSACACKHPAQPACVLKVASQPFHARIQLPATYSPPALFLLCRAAVATPAGAMAPAGSLRARLPATTPSAATVILAGLGPPAASAPRPPPR